MTIGYIDLPVSDTNPKTRDEHLIGPVRRSHLAVVNVAAPWYFKKLRVTVAGNVAIENQFGESVFFPLVQVGEMLEVVGRKVLSAGTTATGIYVYTSE